MKKNKSKKKPYVAKSYVRESKIKGTYRSKLFLLPALIIPLIILFLTLPRLSTFIVPSYDDYSPQSVETVVEKEVEESHDLVEEHISEEIQEVIVEDEIVVYDTYYKFSSDYRRDEHFEKHKAEFNYTNALEYVAGANRVINNEQALHKFEAEDGDDVYFLESTSEIVFVSPAGIIRTYFVADDGIAYYNRQ